MCIDIDKNKINLLNKWDIIIERAHARIVNKQRWGQRWNTMIVRNHEWELNHEWWIYGASILNVIWRWC